MKQPISTLSCQPGQVGIIRLDSNQTKSLAAKWIVATRAAHNYRATSPATWHRTRHKINTFFFVTTTKPNSITISAQFFYIGQIKLSKLTHRINKVGVLTRLQAGMDGWMDGWMDWLVNRWTRRVCNFLLLRFLLLPFHDSRAHSKITRPNWSRSMLKTSITHESIPSLRLRGRNPSFPNRLHWTRSEYKSNVRRPSKYIAASNWN